MSWSNVSDWVKSDPFFKTSTKSIPPTSNSFSIAKGSDPLDFDKNQELFFLSVTKHPFYWLEILRHWDLPCHQSLCLDLHLILWPTVWPLVTLYNAIIDVCFGSKITTNRHLCRMRLPISCANASLRIQPPLSCAVKDCLRMLLLLSNATPVRVFFEPFWSQVNITAGTVLWYVYIFSINKKAVSCKPWRDQRTVLTARESRKKVPVSVVHLRKVLIRRKCW